MIVGGTVNLKLLKHAVLIACPQDRANFLATIGFWGFIWYGRILAPPFMTKTAHSPPIMLYRACISRSWPKMFSYLPGQCLQRQTLLTVIGGQWRILLMYGETSMPPYVIKSQKLMVARKFAWCCEHALKFASFSMSAVSEERRTHFCIKGLRNGRYLFKESRFTSDCTNATGMKKRKSRTVTTIQVLSLRKLSIMYGSARFLQ